VPYIYKVCYKSDYGDLNIDTILVNLRGMLIPQKGLIDHVVTVFTQKLLPSVLFDSNLLNCHLNPCSCRYLLRFPILINGKRKNHVIKITLIDGHHGNLVI